MIRVILPLAILASLWVSPLIAVETDDSFRGEAMSTISGQGILGDAVSCWIDGEYSIAGDCAPQAENQSLGYALAGAALVAALAVVFGVVGILPVIGRLTSIFTIAAGLVAIGAMGFLILDRIASPEGLGGVSWGSYLTGGCGLLTMISGLSGIRGR